MRKPAAVFTFVLLVGGLLLGSLQPASSQAPPQGRTLTFFDPGKTDFEKNVNVGPKRFSSGDWTVLKDRFFDTETCEKAGVLLGRFTFVKSIGDRNGYFLMDGGMLLPDGRITFYWPGKFSDFGEADAPPTDGAAVTGGTGPYEGAGGTVTVQEGVEMCDRAGALVTVQLSQ